MGTFKEELKKTINSVKDIIKKSIGLFFELIKILKNIKKALENENF